MGSIITLKCAEEAKWSESGGSGDVSDYFSELILNPEDSCLVCNTSEVEIYNFIL